MADRAIARRYAKAFIELAAEQGVTDQLLGDIQRLHEATSANNGQLMAMFSNPVFSTDEQKAVFQAILPKLGLHPLSRNLVNLLIDKRRFALLPDLVVVGQDLADELAGRQRVRVETATPVGPQFENELRDILGRLTGKQVVLELAVRPDLIGGMVAYIGGKVYDASIKARLESLRQNLLRNTVSGSFGSPETAEA